MKKHLTILFLILGFYFGFSQETNFKEYSYTEFFELIEKETDTVFKLSNALIKYNPKTDHRFKDTFTGKGEKLYNPEEKIIVNKRIELNNIQFLARVHTENNDDFSDGVLKDIHFKKDVILKEVSSLNIGSCIFDGAFKVETLMCELEGVDLLISSHVSIRNSIFNDNFVLFRNCIQSSEKRGFVAIYNNKFNAKEDKSHVDFGIYNSASLTLWDNVFDVNGSIRISTASLDGGLKMQRNNLNYNIVQLLYSNLSGMALITDNHFSFYVNLDIDQLNARDEIDWSQFKNKLTTFSSFTSYSLEKTGKKFTPLDYEQQEEVKRQYIDSARYYNKKYFVNEMALKGIFYDYYKSRYDTESANEVYLELKDFETKRMAVRYRQVPSFKTYFTWKTNQFLKVFSAYGTEPARAIIFSLYVILVFALIYLFFPNSWDSHGRKRIVDRYTFFFKYMDNKAGIHEVYLEDKKDELLEFQEFKDIIDSKTKKVPKIFTTTALPLYRWAVSGTKLSASLLKRVDIMKGTWQDLPQQKRVWKSILLVGAFFLAVLYDLFIKILNALMLSINTFTTLGFGEIPIKGLPRYLAIVQGFIGWFMLTIFSVSLISQLLN